MEESVTCRQCGRVFDERGELDDHMRDAHSKTAQTMFERPEKEEIEEATGKSA